MKRNYDDIINLPRHISDKHPHMSVHDRAAQTCAAGLEGDGCGTVVEDAEVVRNVLEELAVGACESERLHRCNADAQSCIRTRSATYCYSVKRDGVIICKRESLVNHRAQTLGMIRSAVIFLLEYYVRIFRDGNRTYICTCFNM